MATSNPTNDPKKAKADEDRIQDLPESEDFRELTPDEEESVVGGGANDGIGGVGVGIEGEARAVRLGSGKLVGSDLVLGFSLWNNQV